MKQQVVHMCTGEASEVFYCHGVIDEDNKPDSGIDWYAHEDGTVDGNEDGCVGTINFCPFCGEELPKTLGEVREVHVWIEPRDEPEKEEPFSKN